MFTHADDAGVVAGGPYKYEAFGLAHSCGALFGEGWATLTAQQWSDLTPQDWSNLPVLPGGALAGMGGGFAQKQYYLDPEIELYLLGSGSGGRHYDPATARFISEDPIRHAAGDANIYRYVGNDPVNRVDPSGMQDEGDLATIVRDRPAMVILHKEFSWYRDFGPDELPRAGGESVQDLGNGLRYHAVVTNVRLDTDTAYIRWLWLGEPTKTTVRYDWVWTRIGALYPEQAEAVYRQGLDQFRGTVGAIHEVGEEIVDIAGSADPIVNAVTFLTGQNPSGRKASGTERASAGAGIIAGAIAATVATVPRILRALRLRREAEEVLQAVKRGKQLEELVQKGGKLTTEAEREALRVYELASDVDQGKNRLREYEAVAAIRYERATGERLVRARKGFGDVQRESKIAGGAPIDWVGAIGPEKWREKVHVNDITAQIWLHLHRKQGIDCVVDLVDAPESKRKLVIDYILSLPPNLQRRVRWLQ